MTATTVDKRARGNKRHPVDAVQQASRFVHQIARVTRRRKRRALTFQLAARSIYRDGVGWLHLDEKEARRFRQVVALLRNKYGPRGDLSRATVESQLQDALVAALRARRLSKVRQRAKVRTAVAQLVASLEAPPTEREVFLPIEGLDLDEGPAAFGGVAFVRFDEQLMESTGFATLPEQARGHLREDLAGKVCAVVRVNAKDNESARRLASLKARLSIDVVNFLGSMVRYNHGWITFPGEVGKATVTVPIRQQSGGVSFNSSALMPLTTMSWRKLTAAQALRAPMEMLDTLAQQARPKDKSCGGRLLAGAKWAGRAVASSRLEQKFAQLATALETVVVPQKAPEIGYRLRFRLAYLLGARRAGRRQVLEWTNDLYDTRSALTHGGAVDIAEDDVGLLEELVQRAILLLLERPDLHSLSETEFSKWLDDKLLR